MKSITNVKKYIKDNFFILFIILLFIFFAINFRTIIINGNSMASTLYNNEFHLGTYHTNNVKDGDIVVINSNYLDMQIIKRVIASPGDTFEIKNNIVYVNDIPINETYIKEAMITNDITKFKLANNEYFVMGDNRNNSCDSRNIGCITLDEIYLKFII